MADEPAYHVEIEGVEEPDPAGPSPVQGRRWIGIRFDCCGAYTRIYRNAEGTAYDGRCPKCLRPVNIKVGPGGTDARFFQAL